MSELFDRAREADIARVAGVRLYRAGKRLRGPCPVCGASEKKRADGAFSANPVAGWADCWACGWEGDVIALEQELRGGTPREAAERLVGPIPVAGALPPRRVTPHAVACAPDEIDTALVAFRTWFEARPAAGTLVETYLRARGIDSDVLALALRNLRFHPAAYWGGPKERPVLLPAMVAQVRAQVGPANLATGGIHLTYLAANGSAKAARTPAKRMFGPQSREGRPGGAWLIGPEGRGVLCVGEGIETTLSAAMLMKGLVRAAAALSLTRLQGGWERDADDLFHPATALADLERPAFTWRAPARERWGVVWLAPDRDMSPIKLRRVRGTDGLGCDMVLDADGRARFCARLAAKHWTAADRGPVVKVLDPGPGRDMNDRLRAARAEKVAA